MNVDSRAAMIPLEESVLIHGSPVISKPMRNPGHVCLELGAPHPDYLSDLFWQLNPRCLSDMLLKNAYSAVYFVARSRELADQSAIPRRGAGGGGGSFRKALPAAKTTAK